MSTSYGVVVEQPIETPSPFAQLMQLIYMMIMLMIIFMIISAIMSAFT